jgi:DNA primase
MGFVDFAAVKAGVTIEQGMQFLGLKMKKEGDQFRSACPACKSGGDRALVVTPAKGFYCFGAKKGGDVIALVAHIRGCNQREAATELQERFLGTSTSHHSTSSTDTVPDTTSKPREEATDGMQPLAHLSTDHEAIEALGLTAEVCQALGIGYASKGVMRGRVVFPLRTDDGRLCGYAGLATSADMSPLMLLPKNLAERIQPPKSAASDVRSFLRVVK